jgi:hypothetical protein
LIYFWKSFWYFPFTEINITMVTNYLFYKGNLFVIFDILSGPVSLIIGLVSLVTSRNSELTLADIFLLLRIFCLERIRFIIKNWIVRLLIKDVFHILYVSRYINLSLSLTFYVYSYLAYRIFQIISPNYFRNVFISMLSMFQVDQSIFLNIL